MSQSLDTATFNDIDELEDEAPPTIPDSCEGTQELFNAASCDFQGFSEHMIKSYGQTVFDEGYNIIKENYDTILLEDGE